MNCRYHTLIENSLDHINNFYNQSLTYDSTSNMSHNVLLIGGHGKVAQFLTPLLLAKSWNVTSVIRSAEQRDTIEKLGKGQPGKLDVLVSSVEDVKSEGDAKSILDKAKPDWVVWTAGTFPLPEVLLIHV